MALSYPQIPPRAASRQMYRNARPAPLTPPQQRWQQEQLQSTTQSHRIAQPLPPTPAVLHELHSEPLQLPPSWHVSPARIQHPRSNLNTQASASSSNTAHPSSLQTQDPSLHLLHTGILSAQTPVLAKSPDCTLPVLLALLHAKLNCLPLELINLSTRFLSNMSLQSEDVSESQRKCASVLDGYVAILKRERMDLEEMIRIGEDLHAREMDELDVRQDREVWWFVARALLSKCGVEL